MAKGKGKPDVVASSRERSLNWHEDQSKFMLEWCMEYLKKQHAGFKFKKAHLMLCANELNKKFAMGVTVDQVDRHYRYHKENWKYIAQALNNSGNTFDETRCKLNISASEKATLCVSYLHPLIIVSEINSLVCINMNSIYFRLECRTEQDACLVSPSSSSMR
jgi:hypothetical protein